jgi:hypothetical protein
MDSQAAERLPKRAAARATIGALELAPEPWTPAAVFAAWSIILLGALARLAPYAGNRSLWFDEAALSLNIAQRSFSGLLRHLDSNSSSGQWAPIVFLMLEKVASELFGVNEFALRLVPLLAAMASLVLFYQVARRCLRPKAALLALVMFTLPTPLIYYASEVKPYSSDVAATLAILLLALMVAQRRRSVGAMLGLGGVGALCMLTSFPSVFVLAGCGLVLFSFEWSRGRRGIAVQLALMAALWTALFLADYLLLVSPVNTRMYTNWQSAFAPAPLFSIAAAGWLVETPLGIFHYTLGLARSWPAAGTFAIGCVALAMADRWLLAMLLSPPAAALLAATLHQYPFGGRAIVFLAPLYLIVMGAGLEFLWDSLPPAGPVAAATIAVLLFYPAAHSVATSFVHPPGHEEIKQVLDYVSENGERGDLLYVYSGAAPAFDFYTGYFKQYQLSNLVIVRGRSRIADASQYEADLRTLRGHPRVWIVMSHTDDLAFGPILDRIGKCSSQVIAEGAQGYLCDLSAP